MNSSIIHLTNGDIALCSPDKFEKLSGFVWFPLKARNTTYAGRSECGITIRMHHDIAGKTRIDHVNGNGLDNRIENLRPASASQNAMNSRKLSKAYSSFKGVSYHKRDNRWVGKIQVNGTAIHLGNFKEEKDAAIAYNNAATKYFGEFSRINTI